MRKVKRASLSVLAAIFFGCMLLACTQRWYLSISEEAGNKALFCFSQYVNCRGAGVHFSSINFYEVNREGIRGETVWALDSDINVEGSTVIRTIVFGIAPKNWIETHPYTPLKARKFYSVNGEYFFLKLESGGYEVLQREEFYEKYVAMK